MKSKRISFLIVLLLSVLKLSLSRQPGDGFNEQSDATKKIKKIFIDPGHGGIYPGAIGNGITEHEKNLEISLKLGELLKAKGYEVKYSRTASVTLELIERAEMANAWGADFLICIHCNSFTNPAANGTETFHHPNAGPISKNYASLVNAALSTQMALTNRGVKNFDFGVLRDCHMPAILIENAFVSNVQDAEKLKTNPKGFAEAIASVFNH